MFRSRAKAWLECSVEKEIAAGDHDIVLFRLHRAAVTDNATPPIFHASAFHRLAARFMRSEAKNVRRIAPLLPL